MNVSVTSKNEPSPPRRSGGAGDVVARTILLLLVVASPWPFGSVTPRISASLVLALTCLAATFVGHELVRAARVPRPVGGAWVIGAVALIGFQLVPLPGSLVSLLSPASADIYRGLHELLGVEAASWHPVSVEPFETAWTLGHLLALASAYLLASRLFARRSDRETLAVVTTLVGVALAFFGIYQRARFGTVIYGRYPTSSGTPFGPFVNHNHFAGYVEACALVALGSAFAHARRSGAASLLFGGGAAFMVIALVLSQSRGGLLAFVFGLGVFLALAYVAKTSVRIAVAVPLGMIAVASFLLLYAPSGTFDRWARIQPSADSSLSFRSQLWSDSLGLAIRGAAAGTGLGTYGAVIPAYRSGPDETRADHAESDWLELACETGAIGFAIALAFLAAVGRRALSDARDSRSEGGGGGEGGRGGRGSGPMRAGVVAAAAALVLHGFVDFNFRVPSNALLFAVLLGAIAPALSRPCLEAQAFARKSLASLLVLGAIGLGVVTWAMAESRGVARAIDPLLTSSEEFASVLKTLGRSRERMPFDPRTQFLTGRLYNEEAYRSPEETGYREARLGQAVDQFHLALRGAPARGRYWFELAWTEANRGNRDAADRLFTRALALEPHWSDLRANHALFLAATGRTDQAIEALDRGRALDPGLTALDAISIIGPYVGHDESVLRKVAGSDEAGELALAQYRRALER